MLGGSIVNVGLIPAVPGVLVLFDIGIGCLVLDKVALLFLNPRSRFPFLPWLRE